MPTYDYRCTKCKHVFELFHSMTDDTPRRCPKCKSKATRVPSAGAGLLFKGSGFYITDYRSNAYQEKAKAERGESGKSSDAAASGGAEGKSDAGASKSESPAPKKKKGAAKRQKSGDA